MRLACNFSDRARHGRNYTYGRLKNRLGRSVKHSRRIMRDVIIRSISPEDAQNMRRLLAIEGYLDLGMFEEAQEELRALDPLWFALDQTVTLQMRFLVALSQGE